MCILEQIEKEYRVITSRKVSDTSLEQLRTGVRISFQRAGQPKQTVTTLPCVVDRVSPTALRFVLREGKNRQIRKMLGAMGHDVRSLTRVRFGPIGLEGLSEGEVEPLSHVAVRELMLAAGLDSHSHV